jgi:hypothetical protein
VPRRKFPRRLPSRQRLGSRIRRQQAGASRCAKSPSNASRKQPFTGQPAEESWRETTQRTLRASFTEAQWSQVEPLFEQLVACEAFSRLLDHLTQTDGARRDAAFSPTKITQRLLVQAVAIPNDVSWLRDKLRELRKPFDADIELLREMAARRSTISGLLEVGVADLERERDKTFPIHPNSPAPTGKTTRRSLMLNEIKRLIPQGYPKPIKTVREIARALGIKVERDNLRDLFRRKVDHA